MPRRNGPREVIRVLDTIHSTLKEVGLTREQFDQLAEEIL